MPGVVTKVLAAVGDEIPKVSIIKGFKILIFIRVKLLPLWKL
jgi:hypothetical protein